MRPYLSRATVEAVLSANLLLVVTAWGQATPARFSVSLLIKRLRYFRVDGSGVLTAHSATIPAAKGRTHGGLDRASLSHVLAELLSVSRDDHMKRLPRLVTLELAYRGWRGRPLVVVGRGSGLLGTLDAARLPALGHVGKDDAITVRLGPAS